MTPALFAVADTPEKMAALDPDRILELIREVGLAPTKARNLWTAANQIVDAGGEVIPDWDFLEGLAGVGHKTASVVMAQAFGVPAFPVDTHIHRLAARWGLSSGVNVERPSATTLPPARSARSPPRRSASPKKHRPAEVRSQRRASSRAARVFGPAQRRQ